jgi:flavin reductase (DIM6/NTAB) family NADH-FMN oxidoreductase RutF
MPGRAQQDEPAPPTVGADVYREVMRRWPSGVTVVTMPTPQGPHGMTASAFTSVSINPPLVLVVVDKRWRSHAMIWDAGSFCVNILGEDQAPLSDRFAGRLGPLDDQFAGVPHHATASGGVALEDALAFLDCRVDGAYDAGDHTIFVGRVNEAGVGRGEPRPLLYVDRDYARIERIDPAG